MNEIDYGDCGMEGLTPAHDLPTLTFPEMCPAANPTLTFPEMCPAATPTLTFPEMSQPALSTHVFPEMSQAALPTPEMGQADFCWKSRIFPEMSQAALPTQIFDEMNPVAPPTFDEMSPVAPPTLAQPDTFAYEDMSAPGVGLDDVPPPPCSTPSNLLDLWQFVPQGDSQYIPDLDLATCLACTLLPMWWTCVTVMMVPGLCPLAAQWFGRLSCKSSVNQHVPTYVLFGLYG